jgi:hypothetical protein
MTERPSKADVRRQLAGVESILRAWDPIGVLPGPDDDQGPMDEYDSYAPAILSMLYRGVTVQLLAEHLSTIRTEFIGLPRDLPRDTATAEKLCLWWAEQRKI